MTFGGKTPTKRESARMDAIKESGCVIALYRLGQSLPCDVHHLTLGGKHGAKRLGHRYTVGINGWSHRGVLVVPEWSEAIHRARLGPSYAKEPRAFRAMFSDDWLLEQTDALIGWIDEEAA